MKNLLKLPTMKSKSLSHNKNHKKLLTDIGGGWYIKTLTKVIPLLIKMKLSEKAQEKDDEIKWKLHTANRNWNDWKLQLHWNKLEWVKSRSKIKRKKSIQLIQSIYILINTVERIIGLAIHY